MTQWGLDTLFNPSKRHMDEEKRRLQTTREQIGDSSGGRRIDLESGKVRIRRDESKADEEPVSVDDPALDEPAADDQLVEQTGVEEPGVEEPPVEEPPASTAAERARRRRRG